MHPRRTTVARFTVALAFASVGPAGFVAAQAPAAIDRLAAASWARANVKSAAAADDAEFVRRIYLDLAGRIPTRAEAEQFGRDPDPGKRAKLIDRLLAGGDFPRHWMENLNAYFGGGPAFGGNPQWRAWLEQALRQNMKWDELARTLLRPRPDRPQDAGASLFLLSRLEQGPSGLDMVTRDVGRLFFGVDVQCARCHKHPEVSEWKQESYWGMAAFFNRTYPISVKGARYVAERASGDVEFTTRTKLVKTALPRFLSGTRLTEPKPKPPPKGAKPPAPGEPAEDPADYLVPPEPTKDKTRVPVPRFSRRGRFVEATITAADPYFKRAAVNYVWWQLLGRGLVEPIDQMHDGNPPSQPELLQFLADDFAAHGFDLRYLIRTIANSRVYQLSSRYPAGSPRPAEATFACGLVRPLTPWQLGVSLLVATGYYESEVASADATTRGKPGTLRARLEARHAARLAELARELDSGPGPYQPGVREALFQANSQAFADLVAKGGMATRLAALPDDAAVAEAFWCILARPPAADEAASVAGYLRARSGRRPAACQQVVWALLSSPEFRFNH